MQQQFERMAIIISGLYPDLSATQIKHACNLIGNELKRLRMDIYRVELSVSDFPYKPGYFTFANIECAGGPIYVRVTVD